MTESYGVDDAYHGRVAHGEADYYQVLGVEPDADQATIRRAYHAAARRWHPDRHSADKRTDSDRAEREIRLVNEAWEVLGDRDARLQYDRRIGSVAAPSTSERAGVVNDAGVIRIDPRLLDPKYMAARRQSQDAQLATKRSRVLTLVPLIALLGLLGAIFVFTAYARTGSNTVPPSTIPGPQLGAGIEANDCVSVMGGGSLIERPCDATAHGRVIGARMPDGVCPVGTVKEASLSNGLVVCLGLVG